MKELKRTRPVETISADLTSDVAIIGGGIAGISSAFFILKNTDKNVILLEAGKVAHGATGHNAGQLVALFERPFHDIVREFGLDLSIEGMKDFQSAWPLLEEILKETRLKTPCYQFTGYKGFVDLAELLIHLKDKSLMSQGGIDIGEILVDEHSPLLPKIPSHYAHLYRTVSRETILCQLETSDPHYFAAFSGRAGCMNSALFCEELVGYLLSTYKERFLLVEESPVNILRLREHNACMELHHHTVEAARVVLCTNGFEKITIINEHGMDINTKFHHLVEGWIGYMMGYVEKSDSKPTAIAYLPPHATIEHSDTYADPYVYLTRRPFNINDNQNNLVCVGGPEVSLPEASEYVPEHPHSRKAHVAMDTFVHSTYAAAPKNDIDYMFKWHGLMGYTPNGIRCIGPEPCNPVLLYNLGCNGIGILPSIFGGKKISRHINGEHVERSIFDPFDATCLLKYK